MRRREDFFAYLKAGDRQQELFVVVYAALAGASKASNVAFRRNLHPALHRRRRQKRILVSRSGKVPALIDGDVTIWIRFPLSNISPSGFRSAIVARGPGPAGPCAFDFGEMHSGFMALRNECGMKPAPAGPRDRAVGRCARQRRAHPADLGRVPRVGNGPFLFGPSAPRMPCSRPWCTAFAAMAIASSRGEGYMDT